MRAWFFSCLVLGNACALFGQTLSDLSTFQDLFEEKQDQPVEIVLLTATTRLDQAIEINDRKAEATALTTIGLIHLNRTHDYEKAMDFLVQSLAIEDSLHLEEQQVFTYVGIARLFETVGDFYNSAQFLDLALKLNIENDGDLDLQVVILNNLGKVRASMGLIEEASENYEKVLRYKDDIAPNLRAEALFNLGHLFTLQGNYTEALRSHKQALAITRKLRDKKVEALSLTDIGDVYALMNNDEKSMANHTVALEIRQALNDKKGIAESYNNLGQLFYKQKQIQTAIDKALLALESGRESQAQEQIYQSYELLSQCYKDLGDFKNALTYRELSVALNEFMQNERHERQLLETQNRYVIGKKEDQILKLEALRIDREKQIESQKEFKNFLMAVIALTLIIVLLTLFLYLMKRRSNLVLHAAKDEVQQRNTQLQALNATKDKFFSIISHDLKGPLNSLTSFSHLLIDHTDNMSKEDIQMLARDLDKSVKNLFALLENLLEWSRSQTGNIDFTPEVFDLAGTMEMNKNLLESQAKGKQIRIVLRNNDPCIVRAHKHSINTVVRNLISNAIKFTGEGGTITLNFHTKGGHTIVSVADTGIGMTPDALGKLFRLDKKYSTNGTANEKGTGLGLILCKDFVEKNGGKMHVSSEPGKGSVFSFSIPHTPLTVPATSEAMAGY